MAMSKRSLLAVAFILVLLVSMLVGVQSVKAVAKTIVVPDDYPTIQAAVDAASAGDTVFVKTGNYTLTGEITGLTIDKSISLIGENKDNTILVQLPYKYNYDAIAISADNVTFSGFTVKEGTWRDITVGASGCKITDNNIINSYVEGIDVSGSDNVISGNNIMGNGGVGIYVTANDSVISNNSFANNGGGGMVIDSCKNVTVSQNNITENNGVGLDLRWTGPFYVEDNNITNDQGFGIQFGEGCNNSTVCKNNIADNYYGVNLLNYLTIPSDFLGFGNQVFGNNIVNNGASANVEHTCAFTANVTEGEGNGTDVVSWDNGVVGNYWSDYQTKYPTATEIDSTRIGNTPYLIDENNTDHYPLLQQVDFSATLPTPTPFVSPSPTIEPTSEPTSTPPEPTPTSKPKTGFLDTGLPLEYGYAIVAAIVIIIVAGLSLVYFKKLRK